LSKASPTRVDLLSLRLLIAAVDEGNLAAVAARENIALSGVSRRIMSLEQRWGIQLLHRHDRGVRPTAALETIISRLRGVFQLLDQIADDISAMAAGTRGLIRLNANITAMNGALIISVARFMAIHPSIEVELEEATSVDILHALRVGTCDVGVVSGTVETEGLSAEPWLEDELVAVLPRSNVLANEEVVRFAQLLDHPFIALQRSSALQALYRSQAATIGRTMDERAHVGSFSVVQKLVGLGLGVSILPSIAVHADSDGDIIARPLDEVWSRRLLMICTPPDSVTNATKQFLHFLQNEAKEG
jgi:DNA-binding transcriptional LysR family regulator